jgi:hypothetical protein
MCTSAQMILTSPHSTSILSSTPSLFAASFRKMQLSSCHSVSSITNPPLNSSSACTPYLIPKPIRPIRPHLPLGPKSVSSHIMPSSPCLLALLLPAIYIPHLYHQHPSPRLLLKRSLYAKPTVFATLLLHLLLSLRLRESYQLVMFTKPNMS